MGELRQGGIITQSNKYPYAPYRAGRPWGYRNSAGIFLKPGIDYVFESKKPTVYARQDDGGVFTSYDTAANEGTANDVALLPALEAVNDAFYFGSNTKYAFIIIWIGTAGVGGTITWEYYNGAAWAALTVTDGTTGFTAAAGYRKVSFTPPTDWAETTVNATSAYWIRARVTAANFTTQPLGNQIFMGAQDESDLITDIIADGTETKIAIGTVKGAAYGIWNLYINGVLDSSGYDDYAAAGTDILREITLTQPLRKGWNQIILKCNGKNASGTGYFVGVYGMAVY